MKIRFGIKTVDQVKAFRNLAISFAAFWARISRGSEDGVGRNQVKWPRVFPSPQFQFGLILKRAQKNLARRVRDTSLLAACAYHSLGTFSRRSHSRVVICGFDSFLSLLSPKPSCA